jgi:sialic acid synthase SpsE
MNIGARRIGSERRCYVIAEIGVNHDGDAQRALNLIDAAAVANADAVKFQYFETDLLVSSAAKLAGYQQDAGEVDAVGMLRRLELSIAELDACVHRAHARGLDAIVTVFSLESVDAASALAWDAFKSASSDIVNRPLLDALAGDGRPLIVSTGASTLAEVGRAAGWLSRASDRLAMLQCVSSYPADDDDAALAGIGAIHQHTGFTTGYSDHTASVWTAAHAVAAGACILEKHLTLDRSAPGPDHAASLEPAAFASYVDLARRSACIRPPASADPSKEKTVLPCERDVRRTSRQSIVALRDVALGETVTRDMLTIKRPGGGVEPWRLDEVVGAITTRGVEADKPITPADVGLPERVDESVPARGAA